MIAVIDYGAGNLRSVCNALTVLGADFFVAGEPGELERGSAILLPGVGHFGQMVQALDSAGLATPLVERLRGGTPYLGICLGMQALLEASEEAPGLTGFGLVRGTVRRFPPGERVPHMGWTQVETMGASPLARPGTYYFAHSYFVPAETEGASGVARHGLPFLAILERGSLAGCQFHPEKSGPAGLDFLKAWVEKCRPSA